MRAAFARRPPRSCVGPSTFSYAAATVATYETIFCDAQFFARSAAKLLRCQLFAGALKCRAADRNATRALRRHVVGNHSRFHSVRSGFLSITIHCESDKAPLFCRPNVVRSSSQLFHRLRLSSKSATKSSRTIPSHVKHVSLHFLVKYLSTQ